jgi:hypothetical protein
MNERVCTSGGIITEVLTDKPAPIPFCPPQTHVDWPGFRPGPPKG